MPFHITIKPKTILIGVLIVVAAIVYRLLHSGDESKADLGVTTRANAELANPRDAVDLSESQLAAVKVAPVEERDFPIEKEAVGSIDFNENMTVQVFTPYQGRII